MSSTFLSRFSGKTQSITKTGIDNVLRGNQGSAIYTGSTEGRTNSSISALNHSISIPRIRNSFDKSQENVFHLPPLQSRGGTQIVETPKSPSQRLKESRGRLIKDTNWMIEDQPPELGNCQINRNGIPIPTSSRPQDDNKSPSRYQQSKMNTHHQKGGPLGGLGPNLNKEWEERRQKTLKAMRYAMELKRGRKKRQNQNDENSGISFKRILHQESRRSFH